MQAAVRHFMEKSGSGSLPLCRRCFRSLFSIAPRDEEDVAGFPAVVVLIAEYAVEEAPAVTARRLFHIDEERVERFARISVMLFAVEVAENAEIARNPSGGADFSRENASDNHVFPPKETVIEKIKYIEKPQPKISEIRIFFDNGTFEVFRPEK